MKIMLDIEDFKKKINEKSRLMGIDPGKSRVGISISDENRKVATPHKTLEKKDFKSFKEDLNQIIKDFSISGVIIGNPIKMDLAINVSKHFSLPVLMWDERFSSEGSFKIMKELPINTTKKRKTLDKNAAAFILQGFLDYLNK